jgi:hypothetical protein
MPEASANRAFPRIILRRRSGESPTDLERTVRAVKQTFTVRVLTPMPAILLQNKPDRERLLLMVISCSKDGLQVMHPGSPSVPTRSEIVFGRPLDHLRRHLIVTFLTLVCHGEQPTIPNE